MGIKLCEETGLLFDDDYKKYLNFDRMDILYGFEFRKTIFECPKCWSIECKGTGKCKGWGSYGVCCTLK